MTKIILASILLVTLSGCATHGKVEIPHTQNYDVEIMEKKKISYEITYQAPTYGFFGDGDMQESMPISEARLNSNIRMVLNNFNPILASQLPSNALIINAGDSDYKVLVHIKAFDGNGPVTLEDLLGETMLKEMLSLGIAAKEQEVVANFQITYSVTDSHGKELITKNYKVNDSIEHEKGDYETDIGGNRLTGDLFKKHVTLTLNKFVKEVSKLKIKT